MRCPACGYENPPGMRFCGQCGTALVVSASPGEERKLVTVLFADVVGSTRLSGATDPEQVRGQMTRFFESAREEVHRYGGTVEKFIGDAVMAVFGLPVIHEDDPERAARAAASLRARVRSEVEAGALPEIRIGINTGEVVADARAADKGEFLVTGEAVNLAARLQQHAESGQVLIGERTMLALRDVAQLRPVPPLTVKGLATPLPAWELVEIAPARERQVRATPFVGRTEELDLLHGYVRRMEREGRGHVITILGPAGVGKTRLIQEFRAQTDDLYILRGRALPYGTGVPFWALGAAIREECGILLGDPLEVARRRLQDALERLEVIDAAPALLAVLGLGGDGRNLTREALFSGMRTFFQALAQRTPLVLILEDVHSAEDVTLDYIEHSAGWLHAVPVLLLVLARPELLERRPAWMGGKRSATTLSLEPLPGAQSRELLLGVLGRKPAPAPLLDLVLDRAEGNPLFMEEMLRALVERGVLAEHADHWVLTVPMAQVAIPDSVHAVIAARVDALPVAEKRVLQTAAVVGKDFWLGAVRFITDENHVEEALGALVGKDVLVLKQRSTLVGEEEYTFRHILIRDVAYAMFPKSQRWPKHARCAEWLHQIGGNRHAEFADVTAHHWLQVVALRRDLGLPLDARARDQAIANLLVAGDRAAGVYANTTALDHYTRALDLEPHSMARLQALLGRGQVWMLLGQYGRAREDFAAVRALAQEAGERRWEAVALDCLGVSYRRQDQIAQALEHAEAALALSREVDDLSLTGGILNHIGFTYFSISRHEEAIRSHQEARRLLESCGDLAGLAGSLHGLGENVTQLGRFREGIRWLSESLKVSDQIGNRSLSGENRYMLAVSRHGLGEYAEAQVEAERSIAALAEIGDVWNSSFALSVAAHIATTLGQFGKALEYATRGLGLARQIGAGRAAVLNLWRISLVHAEMEDPHDAWQAAQEGVELARTGEVGALLMWNLSSLALNEAALGRTDEAHARIEEARRGLRVGQSAADYAHDVAHTGARVLLALGRRAEALAAAKVLLEEVAASENQHWRTPAMLLLADTMFAIGDQAAAVPVYEAVAGEAQALGLTPVLWRALAGLGEAQRALGRVEESAASARRAREIIDRLAATVLDERLRATFLQSTKVQRVAALAGA
jgi:class 3 adenylate cyclase/tetratricopeptide (TPR) repeat protein